MRIRKNTKLSSMLLATAGYGGERPETYVCHLNQSPWDVIPVTNLLDSSWFLPSPSSSSPSPPPPLPLIHQFHGEEDNFNGNVSLDDCNGAAQRFNTSVENNRSLVSVEQLNLITAADNYDDRSPDVEEEPMDLNEKSKAIETNSPDKTAGVDEQVTDTMPAPPKRGRPRGTAKKAPTSSNNPYEFYYYSGFGPRWGRKRGGSGDEKVTVGDNESKKSSSSSEEEEEEEADDKTAAFGGGSGGCYDEFDYVEEENSDLMDQDSDDHHNGKKNKKEEVMTTTTTKKRKRTRKPIKERSLKSLM